MTDGTRVAVGRVAAAVAVVAALAGWGWMVLLGRVEALWQDYLLHNGIVAVGFGAMVWMVLPSQPRNRVVWVAAVASTSTGVVVLATAGIYQSMSLLGFDGPVWSAIPSQLPVGVALLGTTMNALWLSILLVPTVVVLRLPDGRLPSPRWRWLARVVWVFWALGVAGFALAVQPSANVAYEVVQRVHIVSESPTQRIAGIGFLGMGAAIPFSVAGMVLRYRASSGVERQQLRWVAWGAATAGPVLVVAIVVETAGNIDQALALLAVALLILVGAFAVAIGKYRLYEIDTVISRTLVYGSLAVFITVVYVGTVVGLGYLFGAHDEPSPLLGIVATVVIAIAFQPLRRLLQRVANRLVYGRRATPYEVLSSFSQRVATVDPEVLTQIARSLTEGTTADATVVWSGDGEDLHPVAVWPEGEAPPIDEESTAPIVHDGEQLGLVSLTVPPGQPLLPTDRRLLDQVASGLGLALRNLTLTDDLRHRVDQLRDSRRRIVAVQDQTRRRLERDLHDGAQQRLVALKIKLGVAVSAAEKGGLDEMVERLSSLRDETDRAVDELREFARGIYPPLLEAEGLGAALTAQARKAPLPVTVQKAGLGRYGREVEAAVYFAVLECLTNAIRHSAAGSVVITLSEREGRLSFEVRDDGAGFDPDGQGWSGGLAAVADRLDSVGGELEIVSRPGAGTVVTGRLPVVDMVPA